jgi:hypothetical protein
MTQTGEIPMKRLRTASVAAWALCAALALLLAPACSAEKGQEKEKDKKSAKKEKEKDDEKKSSKSDGGIEFESLPKAGAEGTMNASGVVALGDSRFLICDNLTNDALFEIALAPDGGDAKVTRRPIVGIPAADLEDIEAMTSASENGRSYVFASTSLGMRAKTGGARPGGLMRLTEGANGALAAEMVPGFRTWLASQSPLVAEAATREPDAGGLNIEGLAWDPKRHALLVGLRTPLDGGKPVVLPIRIKDLGGAWTGENFEMLAPIVLDPGGGENLGIRSIEYDAARSAFLVILGRATSGTDVPFVIYTWDGNDEGRMTKMEGVAFEEDAKPEGIAAGTLGGRRVMLVVDDAGGYAVLPAEAPQASE